MHVKDVVHIRTLLRTVQTAVKKGRKNLSSSMWVSILIIEIGTDFSSSTMILLLQLDFASLTESQFVQVIIHEIQHIQEL